MKILVTGGAGFIGSHVVDALVGKGHEVVVVDDLSTGKKKNLKQSKDKITFYNESITSAKLKSIFEKEKPEAVYHIAAQIDVRKSIADPKHDADINILGTINILDCMRANNTKKIIYSSTGGAIYGDVEDIPTPETQQPFPMSGYATSKYCSEKYIHLFKDLHKIDYTIVRYSNVYGPRQDPLGEAGVISIFIGNILQGKDCRINGDGKQTRDYVFVGDVVRANLAALEKASGETINIGTGQETDVNELHELISHSMHELTGKKTGTFNGPSIPGEVARSCLKISKAEKALGWKPEMQLKEGIRKTAEFFAK